MKRALSLALALVLAVGALLTLASCGKVTYVIETGKEVGTYYGFTNMVATTANAKSGLAFKLSAVSSGGSKGNLQDIAAGRCDFAIVQNDVMSHAYNDNFDMFDSAITNFKVVGVVYQEVVQIIARKDLDAPANGGNGDGIVTIDELRGKKVSIGEANSGVTINAKQILETAGITLADIDPEYDAVGTSTSNLQDGKIDAFFFTAGAPTSGITELFTSDNEKNFTVVTLTQTQADTLTGAANSFYKEVSLTHDTYDRIPEGAPVIAVAVSAVYIVRDGIPDDDVYAFTKALWNNIPEYASYTAQVNQMNIGGALVALGGVPVATGAQRYYDECPQ